MMGKGNTRYTLWRTMENRAKYPGIGYGTQRRVEQMKPAPGHLEKQGA